MKNIEILAVVWYSMRQRVIKADIEQCGSMIDAYARESNIRPPENPHEAECGEEVQPRSRLSA